MQFAVGLLTHVAAFTSLDGKHFLWVSMPQAVQALVDLQCASWFPAYLEAQGAVPLPVLHGFHPLNNGMDFRRPYRSCSAFFRWPPGQMCTALPSCALDEHGKISSLCLCNQVLQGIRGSSIIYLDAGTLVTQEMHIPYQLGVSGWTCLLRQPLAIWRCGRAW